MLKTEYAFIFTPVQIESENMDKHQVLKIKIKIRQTLLRTFGTKCNLFQTRSRKVSIGRP